MARPSKFSFDEILDAAAAALSAHGPKVTIAQVSDEIGVPVGSIYHRFPSRIHLMASLWLRSVQRFHVGLLETASLADPYQAMLAQAVHQPRFCREHPDDALAMTLYSQSQLLAIAPPELRSAVADVNNSIWRLGREQVLEYFGTAEDGAVDVVAMAIRQTPYGMIRSYVRDQHPIPVWLDDAVRAAADAILQLAVKQTANK
ncbi:TetR/AcrR family transcriptional regulator [Brevibacterium luteolum]|uniref:TetR/AcrR family transcriptional regulator n=1 Tax=Brevibacterium luteolum TaxID=199591 RepID=A0A6G8KUP3_9MICO|nr:TetR/AcrR family transcriptional regulator [Brevibacterium luteolum]QIN28343.1 TetR/AcrR family transcriptional regulator [Brevibacterium luteolum]